MDKKYELIPSDIEGYYKVKALRDFGLVKAGDIGGYVQSEKNLSQEGDCWVFKDCFASENAKVSDNAIVMNNSYISGNAKVYGNAIVMYNCNITDDVEIFDTAVVHDCATVRHNVKIYGDSEVGGLIILYGNVDIKNTRGVYGKLTIGGKIKINNTNDVVIFHSPYRDEECFCWLRSYNKWCVGVFDGSAKELLEKSYSESKEKGDFFKKYVKFVEKHIMTEEMPWYKRISVYFKTLFY